MMEREGILMVKITVRVEGMACGMCEAHINEVVRNAFPVKYERKGLFGRG